MPSMGANNAKPAEVARFRIERIVVRFDDSISRLVMWLMIGLRIPKNKDPETRNATAIHPRVQVAAKTPSMESRVEMISDLLSPNFSLTS